MPLVLIRQIRPLPGRESDAVNWYRDTEHFRRQAGQTSQVLLRSLVDHGDYQLIQTWTSREAYESWRNSAERERLLSERARLLIHEPARLYETL